MGEAALTFSAGFIRPTMPIEGVVGPLNADAQTTSNKMILGAGDLCYLQLTNAGAVEAGAHVTIYRRINEIFHPAKGRYLGELFANVGVGLVTEVTQGLATVRIVRSWGPINAGDRAIRFATLPPEEPPAPGRSLPNIPGYIIALPPSLSLVAQTHIVYIDWGRNDGLRVGDRLDVLRTSANVPVQRIGELKVLALEETTATALVIRSTVPLLRADRIAFQEPSQQVIRRAAAETIAEAMDRLANAAPSEKEAAQPALGAPMPGPDLSRLAVLAKQLEFDPGGAPIKPTGRAALQEIGEMLKAVSDKQIRIEGHTDRMPIGPSLKGQYANNLALSKARAQEIVRHLAEEGGVDQANLIVVGYGDAKPVANNRTEEGRKQNRRIEIVLTPKELPPVLSTSPAARREPDSPPVGEPPQERLPELAPPPDAAPQAP